MAKDKLPIPQMVTIDTRSAAAIWNMGINKWRRLFDRSLKKHIRYFRSERATRYVLIDVMKLAYPGANDTTVHELCLNLTIQLAEGRLRNNRYNREREENINGDLG